MGFSSLNCEVCGHPLLCAEAARIGSLPRWLSQVVIIQPDGAVTRGQYDGYGRVHPDTFELCDGQPALRMSYPCQRIGQPFTAPMLHPMRWDGEQWLVKGLHASEIEAIMYAINHWEVSGNTFDVVTYRDDDWAYRTMTPQAFRAASFNAPATPLLNDEGKHATVYHGLCHDIAGNPTEYTGPSTNADGQGWPAFMTEEQLRAMRDPTTWYERWAPFTEQTDEVPLPREWDGDTPLPRGWMGIVS